MRSSDNSQVLPDTGPPSELLDLNGFCGSGAIVLHGDYLASRAFTRGPVGCDRHSNDGRP